MFKSILFKSFLYWLLWIATLSPTFSQKLWTLEDCINHALKNNLQIKQAENNLEIADQNLLQSRGSQLPSLNANGTHNYNLGRNIDPFTNQFTNSRVQSNNFSLQTNWVLFNGLQVRNTIQQSRYDFLAASYQVQVLKNDISLNIAAAYLNILFNKESLKNSVAQLELTKQQLDRMEKLVQGGTVPSSALYDLRSQLAEEESVRVQSENALSTSYLNLTQLLDLSSEEPFDISMPATTIVPSDGSTPESLQNTIKTAFENQPQIKNAEYQQLSSLHALQVARGRLSPRLTFNATLSTLYSSSALRITGTQFTGFRFIGFTQSTADSVFTAVNQSVTERKPYGLQLKDNYNRFFGVTLSIPILNGLQVRTSINRARLNVQNAELNLRLNKLNLEKNIRLADADAKAALAGYRASENAVNAAQESMRNTERRLEVGLANPFEYSQAKTRLTTSQSTLVRAKYDYLFKMKILDFYKGIPIK